MTRELNLNYNINHFLDYLEFVLKSTCKLRGVIWSIANMFSHLIGSLVNALSSQLIGSLEEVHMPQNGINYPGVTALATAMQHNPQLRVLNLNDNTFTKKGAIAMAEVHWKTLN